MPRNVYDQGSGYLTGLDPPGVYAWLMAVPASAFSFEGWLNTRGIPFPGDPERTCDTVGSLLDLARYSLPWAVVLEFQIDPDPLMFGRLLQYLGRMWCDVKPHPGRG